MASCTSPLITLVWRPRSSFTNNTATPPPVRRQGRAEDYAKVFPGSDTRFIYPNKIVFQSLHFMSLCLYPQWHTASHYPFSPPLARAELCEDSKPFSEQANAVARCLRPSLELKRARAGPEGRASRSRLALQIGACRPPQSGYAQRYSILCAASYLGQNGGSLMPREGFGKIDKVDERGIEQDPYVLQSPSGACFTRSSLTVSTSSE